MLGKYFSLMQPLVPKGENLEEVATDERTALTPVLMGKTSLVGLVPRFEDGSVGDSVGFPKVKPWSIGTEMKGVDLDFGVPTWYDKGFGSTLLSDESNTAVGFP